VFRVYFVSETAQVELKSGRVQSEGPALNPTGSSSKAPESQTPPPDAPESQMPPLDVAAQVELESKI
jgi:hypothetical protein